MTSNNDLLRAFRRVASKRGVRKIAEELPAHASTVYRWLKRDTKPSKALQAAMRRVVEKDQRG